MQVAQQGGGPNPACFPLTALGVGWKAGRSGSSCCPPKGPQLGRVDVLWALPGSSFTTQMPKTLDSEDLCGAQESASQHQNGLPTSNCLEFISRKSTEGGFRTSKYPKCDAGNLDHVKVCVSNVAVEPRFNTHLVKWDPQRLPEAVTCGYSCIVAGSLQCGVKAGLWLDKSGSQEPL